MNTEMHEYILSLYGGEVGSSNLPTVMPQVEYKSIASSLQFSQAIINALLHEEGNDRQINILLVNSTELACFVHPHGKLAATIVVPIGAMARLRVLARLLLQYWDKEYHALERVSPLDMISEDAWFIPERLRPLFAVYPGISDGLFWQELELLDQAIELPSAFDPDVSELLHLAVVHLVAHEAAHFSQKHFELLGLRLSDEQLGHYGLSNDVLAKAVELHADSMAGTLSMQILLGQMQKNYGPNDLKAYSRGFLRLSYMMTMLFGLYEPLRTYLKSYDRERYSHPVVRREIAVKSATSVVNAVEQCSRPNEPEIEVFWSMNEFEGLTRCLDALNSLKLDCRHGKYGYVEENRALFTIHMNYAYRPKEIALDPRRLFTGYRANIQLITMIVDAESLVQKLSSLLADVISSRQNES